MWQRYTEVGRRICGGRRRGCGEGAQVRDFVRRVGDDDTGNSLLAELELGVNTAIPAATRRPCRRSQRLWWMPASGLSLIPARIYYLTPTGLTTSIFSQWDVVLADASA